MTLRPVKKRNGIRRTKEDWIIDIVIYIVMIFVLVLTVYPFYYELVLSLNDGMDAYRGGIYLWPRVFTLDNYRELFSDSGWLTAIGVSVARTMLGTLFGVFVTSIVAYALSFEHVLFRGVYYKLYIFTMYFSGGIIPFYIVLRTLGFINNFMVYVIPGMLNVYYMLILISFYRETPRALYESAWLEGANDLQVFWHIALPISKASLATIALFFAVNQWNSWMDSVYYVTKDSLRPMAYKMMVIIQRNSVSLDMQAMMASSGQSSSSVTTSSIQAAAMILAVVPILCVYPFVQKYFVKGVLIGSVKG